MKMDMAIDRLVPLLLLAGMLLGYSGVMLFQNYSERLIIGMKYKILERVTS
jgi:hypothetical protein